MGKIYEDMIDVTMTEVDILRVKNWVGWLTLGNRI